MAAVSNGHALVSDVFGAYCELAHIQGWLDNGGQAEADSPAQVLAHGMVTTLWSLSNRIAAHIGVKPFAVAKRDEIFDYYQARPEVVQSAGANNVNLAARPRYK